MVTVDNLTESFVGLSTDAKPSDNVRNGSTFREIDTGKTYAYDAEGSQWVEQAGSSGGGGGGSEGMKRFIVNFDLASGTSDKTFAEIKAAYTAGDAVEGRVLMNPENNTVVILPLAYTSESGIGFVYTTLEAITQSMYVGMLYKVEIDSDDNIYIESGTVALNPN